MICGVLAKAFIFCQFAKLKEAQNREVWQKKREAEMMMMIITIEKWPNLLDKINYLYSTLPYLKRWNLSGKVFGQEWDDIGFAR